MEFRPPAPRYLQVAEHLREAILRGDYKPGEALPGEPQLAQRYNLSRPTIRQAIAALRTEGLVAAEHGRGTFVRERRPVLQVSSAYLTQGAQWADQHPGLVASQVIREVVEVPATDEVAVALHLVGETRVVVRRRLMLVDDDPVQLADSYYPAELVRDTPIADPAKLPGGTIAALKRLGLTLDRFEEYVATRMPAPDEIRTLRLAEGVPVIVLSWVAYAEGDTPVEYSVATLNGERHRLKYEFPAQP